MKKFFVASVLIIALLSLDLTAFADNMTLSMESRSVEYGTKQISVDVVVSNNPGVALLSFDVGYNTKAMTLVSVTKGNIDLSQDIVEGDITQNPYTVLAFNGKQDRLGNGVVATLNFSISDNYVAGEYNISLLNCQAYTINENKISLNTLKATITLKDKDDGLPPSEDEDDIVVRLYNDVSQSDWYYNDVIKIKELGLMSGMTQNSFCPKEKTTRAMIITVLYRMAGQPQGYTGESWYGPARAWAIDKRLTDGNNLNDYITREQLATMLYRYKNSLNTNQSLDKFTDASSVSDYAKTAMAWCVEKGIFMGNNNMLCPKQQATRAESAAVLVRFNNI